MTTRRSVVVTGIGAWARGVPDWSTLRGILHGESAPADDAPLRPSADALSGPERRRAPDSVRLAVEVASQACAMARCDPLTTPCVFASTWGDIATTDYVCATLARTPLELSPTRFHNSVLNAPAGYWTIATGCTAASSAVTAHHRSFAAGLLESLALACADGGPVLYAACDTASAGPLAETTRTTLAFGVALVLDSDPGPGASLRWSLGGGTESPLPRLGAPLQPVADDNPSNAHALALLSALADRDHRRLVLPLSPGLALDLETSP